MNRPRLLIGILSMVTMTATFSTAQSAIPNSPQGFQQQYHAVFESFRAHNDSEMQSRLETFAIPAHWFKDSFAPDRASELAAQYAKEFAEFKRRTAAGFAAIERLKAQLNIDSAIPVDIRTRRWTVAEDTMSMQRPPGLQTTLPQAQKFAIDVIDTSSRYGRLTSSIEAFIYVDGAFRYFGRQGRPFWVNKP
jgi:hypothetical protein